ncbi:hypothetical protein [Hyphomonas jannaschiana]|uniref:hypothetical protein n=1 Tax=Hyphomonas jannaschiana TaxID=86 RepID=UPI00054EA8AE|nr:hypothetical protein [Hyphomonas jannaschiana]
MGDSVLWAADSYLFFANFDLTDERPDIGFGKLAIVRISECLRDGDPEFLHNLVAKLINGRTPLPIQQRDLPFQTLNLVLLFVDVCRQGTVHRQLAAANHRVKVRDLGFGFSLLTILPFALLLSRASPLLRAG